MSITTDALSLYETRLCPYCMIVRRAIAKLGIEIESRDTGELENWRALQEGGGKTQVPCLRIVQGDQVEWLYESNDIIHYLFEKFG